ncbi:MAG: adenylate/guanylate cyclase domain-containing protein [Pseudomonadota bacterium]
MTLRERWRGSLIGQAVRRIGALRAAVTVALLIAALLFARYSWDLTLARDAERALYDTRLLLTAPRVDEDPRIVLVVYDEETLALTGKRSPLDRAILAKALRNLDALKPKAIGIDVLFDQAQPEDDQLIAAFRSMKTPVKLAFGSNLETGAYIQPWQEAFMRRFQASLKPGNVAPTSIRFEADPDGVMRSWPRRPAGLPPLFADALAPGHPEFAGYDRSLLYRLPKASDRNVFGQFAIQLFADRALAEAFRGQIEGRYVLIGGVIADLDQFDTPLTRTSARDETGTMSGLEVHATMLAQLLDDRLPSAINWPTLWFAAAMVVLMGIGVGALDLGPWRLGFALAQSALLLLVVPVLLQWIGFDTQGLPMFGWIGGWSLALVATGWTARAVHSSERRFAQGALGKYLPRDVAKAIIADPTRLSLTGEKRQIYALFTDLEGFTKLTHQLTPEQTATQLNRYLDMLSKVVLDHGGTLDKFVGDAVVAFWGAPIARADDADRAVRAALAMYETGEQFRATAPPDLPPIGRTRVGVHRGEAIVGNFGGEGRIQYTALGDSMNAAARLEGANKSLKTTLLISREVMVESTLGCFRPMGRVIVRGRSTPLEVYEAGHWIDCDEADAVAAMLAELDAGDASALARLRALAATKPEDEALGCLVTRLEQIGGNASYALD